MRLSQFTKATELGLSYNCKATEFWHSGLDAQTKCKELGKTFANYTNLAVQSTSFVRFANYEEFVWDPNTQTWDWEVKESGNKTYCEMDSKCDSEWSWDSGVSASECLSKPSNGGKYCAECWGDTCADWSQFPRCYTTFQAQVNPMARFATPYSSMTKDKCDVAGGTWREYEWMKTYGTVECWDCCVFENVQNESQCMDPEIDRLCPLQRFEWGEYAGVIQKWDDRSFCDDALICYKKDVRTKEACMALKPDANMSAFPKWIGIDSELDSWKAQYTPNDPSSQGACVVDLVSSWFSV
jgi:hypothetical protein